MTVTRAPAVWRAVAHPARRRLIELLGDGPRTTGDLARAFDLSRFAIMKHLAVLERSGLVAVQRVGRERWNALTVPPGLELTLAPVAAAVGQASRLSSEASRLASPALEPFRIEQQTVLDAPASRVFDGLTFNVSAWWGAPYLRSSRATNVVLEPQLGGRLFEEWGHRQGFIRGVVTAIRQDERLELSGRIAGGGPLPAALELALAPAGRGTRLMLVHQGVGNRNTGAAGDSPALYEGAWAELIGSRLKAFVERGERSGVGERAPADGALYGWF